MKTFTDALTGKTYRVSGTTVTQFDGKAFFTGSVLHLWGMQQSVVEFKTGESLNGWITMMGFRG